MDAKKKNILLKRKYENTKEGSRGLGAEGASELLSGDLGYTNLNPCILESLIP